jgi:hypothetical protein
MMLIRNVADQRNGAVSIPARAKFDGAAVSRGVDSLQSANVSEARASDLPPEVFSAVAEDIEEGRVCGRFDYADRDLCWHSG